MGAWRCSNFRVPPVEFQVNYPILSIHEHTKKHWCLKETSQIHVFLTKLSMRPAIVLEKKRTTPGIPTWSPTVVLTGPDDA